MRARNVFTFVKVSGLVVVTVVGIALLASLPAQPSTSTVVDEAEGVGTGGEREDGGWGADDWAVFAEKVRFAEARGLAEMELGEAIVRMAETFVGTTYESGTLELPGPERLVVNFRELDCVTLVETVLALTRFVRETGTDGLATALANPATAQARYEANLTALRYRGGVLSGYPSRLHYFSEWLSDNESRGLMRVVTGELDPVVDPEPLGFMSANPDAYRQLADPDALDAIAAVEARLNDGPGRWYVPEERIPEVAGRIRNGDVVAATSTAPGLDIAHTGFAIWRDGALHLLHAPLVGRAVEISERPLTDRIPSITSQDGIMVGRPVEPSR